MYKHYRTIMDSTLRAAAAFLYSGARALQWPHLKVKAVSKRAEETRRGEKVEVNHTKRSLAVLHLPGSIELNNPHKVTVQHHRLKVVIS